MIYSTIPVIRYGDLGSKSQRKALLIRLYAVTMMPGIAIIYTPNTVVSILYLFSINLLGIIFLANTFLVIIFCNLAIVNL